MRRFLSLLFFVDLCAFFHFGSAPAKNAGDVHPFEPFFVRISHRVLRLLKPRSRFRRFRPLYFLFLYDGCGFSAMKNSGRFHARFSSIFWLNLGGIGTAESTVLKKAGSLVFWGGFCGLCLSF